MDRIALCACEPPYCLHSTAVGVSQCIPRDNANFWQKRGTFQTQPFIKDKAKQKKKKGDCKIHKVIKLTDIFFKKNIFLVCVELFVLSF
jgi:hypothetical protein